MFLVHLEIVAHILLAVYEMKHLYNFAVDAVECTMGEGKLKLQLYPIDEATRRSMEKVIFPDS